MKRILFLMMLLVSLHVQAQYDDEFAKTIRDVIKDVPENSAREFWLTLAKNHPQNIEVNKAIKEQKKSMVEALSTFSSLDGLRDVVSKRAINSSDAIELIHYIEEITKIGSAIPRIQFFVVEDNTPNAGIYRDGTCEINSYWIDSGTRIEELIAICCHEIAHFVLTHQIRDVWKTVKAAKRNAAWAEIGTGLAMGVYAGSQMYAAQYGVQQSSEAQQQMYNNLAKAGMYAYYDGQWIAENRQKFKYRKESETEADETAFWFMEKNGIDPIHLINVFKRMEKDGVKLTKEQLKTDDHPEMSKRIKHIEKLYNKYHNKK